MRYFSTRSLMKGASRRRKALCVLLPAVPVREDHLFIIGALKARRIIVVVVSVNVPEIE